MAKMYYNLEETMAKLNCTEDDLRGMVRTGKLREFRDAGKLNYRCEEVDKVLAEQRNVGGNILGHDSDGLSADDLAEIALAPLDSDTGITKALSGSGTGPAVGGSGSSAAMSGSGSAVSLSGSGTAPAMGQKESPIDLGGSGTSLTGLTGSTEIRLEDSSGGSTALRLDDSKMDSRAGSKAGSKGGTSGGTDAISLDEADKDAIQGMKKDDTVITNIGISVFDDDDLEIAADPMAKTMMTGGEEHLGLDGSGGGSGLLDLTRESDDTSLGAELLEGIDMGDTAETLAQSQTQPEAPTDSGTMPEPTLGEPAVAIMPMQMQMVALPAEPLAPLFTGLLAAATIIMGLAGATAIAMAHDVWPSYLKLIIGDNLQNFYFVLGGSIVIGGLGAGIGWLVAKQAAAGPRPARPAKDKKEKKGKEKGKKGEVGATAAKA